MSIGDELIKGIVLTAILVANHYIPKLSRYMERRKRNSSAYIKHELKIKRAINFELKSIRIELGAQRASLMIYKYGLVSMTHESVADGTERVIDYFQDRSSAPIAEMLEELEENGMVTVNKNSSPEIVAIHSKYDIITSFKFLIGENISSHVLVIAFNRDCELTPARIKKVDATKARLKILLAK